MGFRPFVYRLAKELGLTGWVLNSSSGLVVEVEGSPQRLEQVLKRLECDKPPAAVVLTKEASRLQPAGFTRFEILSSDQATEKTTSLLPDLATCPACLRELLDPSNRRFQFAHIRCTGATRLCRETGR